MNTTELFSSLTQSGYRIFGDFAIRKIESPGFYRKDGERYYWVSSRQFTDMPDILKALEIRPGYPLVYQGHEIRQLHRLTGGIEGCTYGKRRQYAANLLPLWEADSRLYIMTRDSGRKRITAIHIHDDYIGLLS